MSIYDSIANWFVSNRQGHIGIPEVERVAALVPAGGKILDLGCGHGIPIAEYLIAHQFSVFAIDSSARLIDKFRENFPGVPTECGKIQESSFFNTTFDAVIACGVMFHLQEDDQKKVFHKISRVLQPGGILYFTASKEVIADTYQMAGVVLPYISLGYEQYCKILYDEGMELIADHFDQGENYVYIFRKIRY